MSELNDNLWNQMLDRTTLLVGEQAVTIRQARESDPLRGAVGHKVRRVVRGTPRNHILGKIGCRGLQLKDPLRGKRVRGAEILFGTMRDELIGEPEHATSVAVVTGKLQTRSGVARFTHGGNAMRILKPQAETTDLGTCS